MEKYQRWSKLGNDVPLRQTTCKSCNKTIWCKTSDDVYCYDCVKKLGKVVHQLYTKTGKKFISNETRKKLSQSVQQRIKNGTHNGWSTRNTRSFPEIFWEGVLKNNSINFISEKYIKEYGYFLDFYIELSNGLIINLEIDGKQHTYEDRILHDKKRDKRLRNLGYLVYRIPWNEISSNMGKSKIKAKINQFLWWFNQIRKINP
jgi:very-short-patch-repair endonuclease